MKRTSAKLLAGLTAAGRLPSPDEVPLEQQQTTRRNLRTSCGKAPDFSTVLRTSWTRFTNTLAAFLFVNEGQSKRMCRNYGHVTPARFNGMYPHCTECGAKITDPKQVRRSFLIDQPQPLSNIGFQGTRASKPK